MGFVKKEGFIWGHRSLTRFTRMLYENRFQKAFEGRLKDRRENLQGLKKHRGKEEDDGQQSKT